MRRTASLLACVPATFLVIGCSDASLNAETALRLARDQQDSLAARWVSDNDMVVGRLAYDVERTSRVDLASPNAYPARQMLGARLMQKLDRENGVLQLAKNDYVPGSSFASSHVSVVYHLRRDSPHAKYDARENRVAIQVTTPVILSFGQFVELGDVAAMAKVEVGFRPTQIGDDLLKALEEMRKEEPIDRNRLTSPGDDLLVQLLEVEQNMKRRETRYVRYERTDGGWQIAKLQ